MYQIMDVFKGDGDESFLEYLEAFFCKFRLQIEEGKLTDAILRSLEKELHVSCGNTETLSRWMKVVILTDDEERLEVILAIRRALQDQDYGEVVSGYLELIERGSFSRNNTSLVKAVSIAVCEECMKMDNERKPVPLDVWILIGSARYANSFELFDHLTPAPHILQVDEFFVVRQSKLLAKQPYFSQAEDYVHNKGIESRAVRKWLSECKAAEKRKRAEEKRARAEEEAEKRERANALRQSSRRLTSEDRSSLSQQGGSSSRSDNWSERRQPEKKGFLKELFGRK